MCYNRMIKSEEKVIYNTLILALTLNTEQSIGHYVIAQNISFLFFSHRDYIFKHYTSVFSYSRLKEFSCWN